MNLQELAGIFLKVGASSFGGWSTTALLLEKELIAQRHAIRKEQLHGNIAYAQILPGATQVAIVSSAGYTLRGYMGALIAATCYLLPALSLITLFAVLYFHYAHDEQLANHMKGLIATLGGVILANAYRIAQRHVVRTALWAAVVVALIAKLLGANAVVILLSFGGIGLAWSWMGRNKGSAAHD